MKYIASDNKKSLKKMEKMQIFLTLEGEKKEHIWVRKDGDKCYLQNHAVMLYPYPSWGLELDFAEKIDILQLLKKNPKDTTLIFHEDTIKFFTNFIDKDNEFMLAKYTDFSKKELAIRKGTIDKSQLN